MSYEAPPKPAEQIGGDHYSRLGVEPIQFIETNGLGYHEGNIIKYVSRWRNKNGIEDLKKAKWYIERLLDLETPKVKVPPCVGHALEQDIDPTEEFYSADVQLFRTKADGETLTQEEVMFEEAARYFTTCRPEGSVLAYVDYADNKAIGVNAFLNGVDRDSVSFRKSDCEYFAGEFRKLFYGAA